MVGFGFAESFDICCKLSNLYLIDTLDAKFGGVNDFYFDAFRSNYVNSVREAEGKNNFGALSYCLPTNTTDDEVLGVTFFYADNHVLDKSAVKTVSSLNFFSFANARYGNNVAFDRNVDLAVFDSLGKGAERSKDGL